jgi:phosphoglycerol transferase MdoB-like AlkP superfamily enzyme
MWAGARLARPRHAIALAAAIHLAALALMLWSETGFPAFIAFCLTWGLLNSFWAMVLRRPLAATALSLAMIVTLILLARLKQSVLFTTIDFVDVMIVDTDTIAFLLTIFPNLGRTVAITAAVALPALALLWWLDPLRVRVSIAALAFAGCLAALAGLSAVAPLNPHNDFVDREYVSKFARSGVTAVTEYFNRGFFESDTEAVERLRPAASAACQPAGKVPNIVMVFDESSFDISAIPNIKVPSGYRQHFASLDGRSRAFVVEGIGGPSWFTEYNVLTGLSVRSYGRFADFVTRIAVGRVQRGLAYNLRWCGYRTYSLYPTHGAFLSARGFQTTAGIEHFLDMKGLGATTIEADSFYYDAAARTIAGARGDGPLFLLVYTAINHFPWTIRYRPDLLPEWRDPGNGTEVDEYLRRQSMSARAYSEFKSRLARDFPRDAFLIMRFGDHLPLFAPYMFYPGLDATLRAQRIAALDPQLRTTYYAIDAVNFRPADLSSAHDRLDAPYLPLVTLEAAGLSLDPTFAEQKRIFRRCPGDFYRCENGAAARRFNRLLIDAGFIKGL